jgi:hypothetical protein
LLRTNAPTGAIIAPHALARSPGVRPSTCLEYRHDGQWSRLRPPEGGAPMINLQWRHRNSLPPF